MTDLAKLSDADLLKLARRSAPPAGGGGLAAMSDEELISLANPQYRTAGTVEEMHPNLTFMDRLVVKNLSNSPTASMEYLQKKHPKMLFELDTDGRIRAKGKAEKAWKRLDPEGFDIQDLTDVAFDVGAGIAEGTAAAGAGVVAGGGTLGVGALPAAMAAGGATAAGLETLRQAVGKMAGVNQEISGSDIALSGAFGALTPGIFGTGATAKQVAKAGVAQATQRGLLSRGVQKVAPKIGETMSGVPSRAIKAFSTRMPEILKIEHEGVKDLATETAEELTKAFKKVEEKEWAAFEGALKVAPDKIDLNTAKSAFIGLHNAAKMEAAEIHSPAAKAFANQVKSTMDKVFPTPKATKMNPLTGEMIQIPTPPVSPQMAMKVQRQLGDLAKFGKLKPGKTAAVGRLADMTEYQRRIAMAAEDATHTIGDQVGEVAAKYGGEGAKAEYQKAVNLRKSIAKHFSDPQKTYATLSNLNSKGKQILSETLLDVDAKYGTNMHDKALMLETTSHFIKPTLTALSGLGSTSTSRTIPLASAGAGLGYYLGAQSGLGQGGAGLGLAIGGLLGSVTGGPKTIRKIIETQKKVGGWVAGARDRPYLPAQSIPYSAWHMMNPYQGSPE